MIITILAIGFSVAFGIAIGACIQNSIDKKDSSMNQIRELQDLKDSIMSLLTGKYSISRINTIANSEDRDKMYQIRFILLKMHSQANEMLQIISTLNS